jgi:opine dehydrogenase
LKGEILAGKRDASTIAIIGAGIGGVYLVVQLGLAGFRLRLHDIDESRLTDIRTRGGIDVEGERSEFSPIELATTDLGAAIDDADVVIVVTGGNTHGAVARALAPLLRDGQLVLLIQGNTGGSLIVRRQLQQAGCRARVDVAEMDNYPYAAQRKGPTRVRPIVNKRWLQIAVFPANRTAAVFPRLSRIFPQAVAAPDVLHTGLTNMNSMLHVANCVANAAVIERGIGYKFYSEGVTPAVARLYAAIDGERLAVASALGASVPGMADWIERVYGVHEATLPEVMQRLTYNADGAYQVTGTPTSLNHKFIAEDVPTGLIPMTALGAAAGVPTPATDALVQLVRYMTGNSFAAEARTLDRLGLGGMDGNLIRRVVEHGFQ